VNASSAILISARKVASRWPARRRAGR